jgi:copper chaperone CopZ
MTMRMILALTALSVTSPALAQGNHGAMSHGMHAGHKETPARPVVNAAAAQGSGATVRINGLICDFCVQALTRTFRKQAAVRAVAVDLTAKELRLGFKPGTTIDDATIGRLVKDAGYTVVAIARRAS